MTDVKNFTKQKAIDYPKQQELYDRLYNVIHEYDDEMSVASVVGLLDLMKHQIINDELL